MVVGDIWGGLLISIGLRLLMLSGIFQLVICAIPVFLKIPGVTNFDLGSRTEGMLVPFTLHL